MIGGVIMVLAAIWAYQAALSVKKEGAVLWVAGCAVAFFVVQMVFVELNIMIIDGLQGTDISGDYDREITSVGDRQTNEKGSGGMFLSVLFELLPPTAGFITVAFIRTKFILKEALNVQNLFSGIKEMFVSIANSFKTTSK